MIAVCDICAEVSDLKAAADARILRLGSDPDSALIVSRSGRQLVATRQVERLWTETTLVSPERASAPELRAAAESMLDLRNMTVSWRMIPTGPDITQLDSAKRGSHFAWLATMDTDVATIAKQHDLTLEALDAIAADGVLLELRTGDRFLLRTSRHDSETIVECDSTAAAQDHVRDLLLALDLDSSVLLQARRDRRGPEAVQLTRSGDAGGLRNLLEVWLTPEELAARTGLTFQRPRFRPRVQEAWGETTSGFCFLLRRPDDIALQTLTEIWVPRSEQAEPVTRAISEALALEPGDIASGDRTRSLITHAEPWITTGAIATIDSLTRTGWIEADDDERPVRFAERDARGNRRFLQPGARVTFLRVIERSGLSAHDVRWAPDARMERRR